MSITAQNPRSTASFPAAAVRETHSGVVILLGDRAYKVKKPVDLGFLDFRTEAARHLACRREVELNRRLAPDVYLDVAAMSGSGGHVVEHVVVMQRMPEELRLSTLVTAGTDVDDHLRALARLMADFHSRAERGQLIAAEGGPVGLRRRWADNLRETRQFRGTVLDGQMHSSIARLALDYIDGREALLEERASAGLSIDGHGDLIAEDIFCLADHPRVLDCLEFSDVLRWVDVLDDVAFLAMDLERLGRPDLGERFLDLYVEFSGTSAPPSLRHHYVAYRAFVRAKVACIRAAQGVAASVADADTLARLTLAHLQAGEVTLVVVGGAPGTGKSTLALGLADRLGAVLLSTDSLRHELPETQGDPYGDGAKAAVYRELLRRARLALEHGESVVADATWGTAVSRAAAAAVAGATASRMVMLECRLAPELAAARAQHRLDDGVSASEAGAEVARRLAGEREPWPDSVGIDTMQADASLRAALDALALPAVEGAAAPAEDGASA